MTCRGNKRADDPARPGLTAPRRCSSFVLMESIHEFLRQVISVALAVAPRAVKRAFVDRTDPKQQEAQRKLSQAVADAVVRSFEVAPKPLPPPGRGVPARPEKD